MNNISPDYILLLTILSGLIAILYGYITGKQILNLNSGNKKMKEVAEAIQIGAKAYLNRQYKTISIVGLVVLIIIIFAFSILVGIGYLIGATLSGIAGYVGMLVSVKANVRTAEASRKGLSQGLSIAFKSGTVTGMLVAGLALLSISVYYYILLSFGVEERELINALIALGFGASLISIFARLGGGIFTKVARENNLKYLILSNSYNDHSLRDHHAIDPGRKIISGGEQAFISNDNELTPFFWHYGRGVIFGTPDEWFELLDKFLNE